MTVFVDSSYKVEKLAFSLQNSNCPAQFCENADFSMLFSMELYANVIQSFYYWMLTWQTGTTIFAKMIWLYPKSTV